MSSRFDDLQHEQYAEEERRKRFRERLSEPTNDVTMNRSNLLGTIRILKELTSDQQLRVIQIINMHSSCNDEFLADLIPNQLKSDQSPTADEYYKTCPPFV